MTCQTKKVEMRVFTTGNYTLVRDGGIAKNKTCLRSHVLRTDGEELFVRCIDTFSKVDCSFLSTIASDMSRLATSDQCHLDAELAHKISMTIYVTMNCGDFDTIETMCKLTPKVSKGVVSTSTIVFERDSNVTHEAGDVCVRDAKEDIANDVFSAIIQDYHDEIEEKLNESWSEWVGVWWTPVGSHDETEENLDE